MIMVPGYRQNFFRLSCSHWGKQKILKIPVSISEALKSHFFQRKRWKFIIKKLISIIRRIMNNSFIQITDPDLVHSSMARIRSFTGKIWYRSKHFIPTFRVYIHQNMTKFESTATLWLCYHLHVTWSGSGLGSGSGPFQIAGLTL